MFEYKDLPTSEAITTSDDPAILEAAIKMAFKNIAYSFFWTVAKGGPSSCRVYLVDRHPNALEDEPKTARQIAEELLEFSAIPSAESGARYPAEKPTASSRKCWQIRRFDDGICRGAIATAVWM